MTLQINGDKIKTPTGSWIENLIGQKFGRLTVIEPTDKRGKYTESIIWKCRCECGNICYADGAFLRNGEKRSCGCLNKDVVAKQVETEQ